MGSSSNNKSNTKCYIDMSLVVVVPAAFGIKLKGKKANCSSGRRRTDTLAEISFAAPLIGRSKKALIRFATFTQLSILFSTFTATTLNFH